MLSVDNIIREYISAQKILSSGNMTLSDYMLSDNIFYKLHTLDVFWKNFVTGNSPTEHVEETAWNVQTQN
jgi:hypothetical protein